MNLRASNSVSGSVRSIKPNSRRVCAKAVETISIVAGIKGAVLQQPDDRHGSPLRFRREHSFVSQPPN